MNSNLLKIVCIVVVILTLAVYAYAVHEEKPSETTAVLPGPDASKLYDYIAKDNPYTDWKLWPGKGRLYKGREPHGAFLTTYVNSYAYFSAKDRKGKMDYGSIVVKENYTAEKKLAALTVMYKVRGFNRPAADWFWAKYEPFGKVLASGKVETCIRCHSSNKANDFIMTEKIGK